MNMSGIIIILTMLYTFIGVVFKSFRITTHAGLVATNSWNVFYTVTVSITYSPKQCWYKFQKPPNRSLNRLNITNLSIMIYRWLAIPNGRFKSELGVRDFDRWLLVTAEEVLQIRKSPSPERLQRGFIAPLGTESSFVSSGRETRLYETKGICKSTCPQAVHWYSSNFIFFFA